MDNHYDVIVVGGGHAGTEAACASARMGANTLLVTHNIDTIGQMSCNPAIGGIGKTHLVKEIDALGGVMAQAIDRSAIHVRILNESKGPAVQATRMQADRMLYKMAIRSLVESQPNLSIFQQAVDDLLVKNGAVVGLRTELGITFHAPVVVLTVGTFLAGKIHVGLSNRTGGRSGDPASVGLSACLREMKLPVGRLKTGTPPRIAGASIDFDALTAQPSSHPDLQMAYYSECAYQRPAQLPCYLTRTSAKTHDIIREHLDESPMFSGAIEGKGPRYCPSIEDKITRFADRDHHSIFLEPEGHSTQEYYPNGISTSLPYHAQVAFVRSIPGLSDAHITRPGYAIEYDFFDPRCLTESLALKEMPNLFFAGQINGTTGYEEAGAQGLLAGLNAALFVKGKGRWTPGRDEAYLGVLVDDLITQGTKEPYRMFTSRAEYRLQLRQDNADNRLTAKGYELGVVSQARFDALQEKNKNTEALIHFLNQTKIKPDSEAARRLHEKTNQRFSESVLLCELMKRPEINCEQLLACDAVWVNAVSSDLAVYEQVDCHFRYAGYLARQQEEINRHKKHAHLRIPMGFDYESVKGLSNEVRQKLIETQPETIGQASRIPGVTPAAIALLLVFLKKSPQIV